MTAEQETPECFQVSGVERREVGGLEIQVDTSEKPYHTHWRALNMFRKHPMVAGSE